MGLVGLHQAEQAGNAKEKREKEGEEAEEQEAEQQQQDQDQAVDVSGSVGGHNPNLWLMSPGE